jgi:hypothetical protein
MKESQYDLFMISGLAKSGKDTFGSMLVAELNKTYDKVIVCSFAGVLKDFVEQVFHVPKDTPPELKEIPCVVTNNESIRDVRLQPLDSIAAHHMRILEHDSSRIKIVRNQGGKIFYTVSHSPRTLWQDVGEAMRRVDSSIWARLLSGNLEPAQGSTAIVVTDWRYLSELWLAKDLEARGKLGRLVCLNVLRRTLPQGVVLHESEAQDFMDTIGGVILMVDNTSTLERLQSIAVNVYERTVSGDYDHLKSKILSKIIDH